MGSADSGSSGAAQDRPWATVRSPLFWLAPVAVVAGVMCLLAGLYVGGIVAPQKNLHDFRIDLVVEDNGAVTELGKPPVRFGDQVAQGIVDGAKGRGIELRRSDRGPALDRLDTGRSYAMLVIPANFSQSVIDLAGSTVATTAPQRPTIDAFTNRRSGAYASSIATTFIDRVAVTLNERLGAQLIDQARSRLDQARVPFTGASQLALSTPVVMKATESDPLPDGAANGLSALYVTLLLVLAGFTGAMIVQSLTDGLLGFIPAEYGPLYLMRPRPPLNRLGGLAIRWWLMFVIAMLQSALYLLVLDLVGMDNPRPFELWMLSTFVITAVGILAATMMAVFGTAGLLINLVFFVVLGLPSSGGAVPLEASPKIFTWISEVAPMRPIYLGVRSVLYFDGSFASGLGRTLWETGVYLVIGLVAGYAVSVFYDRKGWHRRLPSAPRG
ncbi:YhgE/Pip domain-containing protein [Williamsia sp. CHRR-6]|uniref:YhgE/Pip domain-containing protein n=1 Tax=Williamsia sp. CHRR-6 TaxID=2835871 RepID=UPI001BDA971F|nr:DUF3533 domain-containing protein [Williamsia sp. CHRR-6]MBT0565379.1 DUF3533 domain-containing protein [Williamsia sp. CHRR-6]